MSVYTHLSNAKVRHFSITAKCLVDIFVLPHIFYESLKSLFKKSQGNGVF